MQLQRRALIRQSIESIGMRSLAANGPKHIGEVLFDKRDLCLHCELDIVQARTWTTIRSYTGEYPTTAFLIHQTPRAVDRIDNDSPNSVRFRRATRQNDLTFHQSFGD